MGRKPAADKEEGHNSGQPLNVKLLQDHAIKLSKEKDVIEGARNRIKDIKKAAKGDGFLKMALDGAVNDLRKSDEQIRAQKEVEDQRQYYYDSCKDLPLFAKMRAEKASEEDEEGGED